MKLDDVSKRGHAHMLIHDPLFNEILDGLERAAVDCAVYAKPTENDLRHAYLIEVRAIRSLRAKLKSLAARGEAAE